jgi:hypothetical protein
MMIRESIAQMTPNGPPLAVAFRYQVDYVKSLARQSGVALVQRKQPGGGWILWAVGPCKAQGGLREAQKEAQRRWRARHPERYQCQLQTMKLIRTGVLVRQRCELCGQEQAFAYHEDYGDPMSVHWLCREHAPRNHMAGGDA